MTKSSVRSTQSDSGASNQHSNESHSPRRHCGTFSAADMQRAAEVLQGLKEAMVRHVVNVPSETDLNISIHVRFADACNYMTNQARPYTPVFWAEGKGRPCFEFIVWMQELEIMAERYKTRNVIIATDSNDFLKFILQNKSFNYYYVEYDRSKYQSNHWIDLRSDLDAEIVDLSLTDMWILRQGHAFIAGLCSHYARAVYYLMTGQLGYLPAFRSLDGCGVVWQEWERMAVSTAIKLGPEPLDSHWRRALRALSKFHKRLF